MQEETGKTLCVVIPILLVCSLTSLGLPSLAYLRNNLSSTKVLAVRYIQYGYRSRIYGASSSLPLLSSSVEVDNKGAGASFSLCPTACHALLYDSDVKGLHHVMIGCCICGAAGLTLTIPRSTHTSVFMCSVWI